MDILEYNNKNRQRITELLQTQSVMELAELFDVNWYYTSMSKKDPSYIPRNSDVATKMGYKVYRTSVPHGTPRKKQKRCTIYPNTDPKKIIGMLREVTGIEWLPMIDEMEY